MKLETERKKKTISERTNGRPRHDARVACRLVFLSPERQKRRPFVVVVVVVVAAVVVVVRHFSFLLVFTAPNLSTGVRSD